ncbi:MAG: hypothetical protein H0U47_11210 [Nocardioidaceae bacterium]|nr:hypothetical protein [Nocardioidaceae bacterium]
MSSPLRRSTRRLPARVYWVRRGLVLLVVLLLGWFGWSLGSGAEEPAASSAGSTVADPTPDPSPDAETKPGKTRTGTTPGRQGAKEKRAARGRRQSEAVSTSFGAASATCDPASVRVQPSVTGAAVAGEPVLLGLTLRTTASTPCRIELTPELLLVQVSITERSTAVWDTTRCPGSLPDGTIALQPGWQTMLSVPWSGRLGDRGCSGLTDAAKPGEYAVQAAVIGGEPGRSGFVLSATPPPDRAADDDDRARRTPQT